MTALRACWVFQLAACAAGCAPGDFDALGTPRERGESPAECSDDAQDLICEAGSGTDAEAEFDSASEPASEPDAEPQPEADAGLDGCATCGDAGPEQAPDAQLCDACSSAPTDAALCADAEAGACRGDAGPCQGASPVCSAGQKQSQQQACGACNTGNQTRTRSCAADGCSWSAWSAWSACAGVSAACTPKQTTSCANGDECGQRVCSDSCSWGACVPKVAGGCLRIREGHTDQGSNYRCCGGTGHWQFCLPDCHWSTDCNACSEGEPNYCSDCY